MKMFPKNAPSRSGKAAWRPQPISGIGAVSHSGMCTPVVFTSAIMQAEIFSWQFWSHAPASHVGPRPTAP